MMKCQITLCSLLAVLLFGCEGLQTRDSLREQEQKKEFNDRVSNLQKSSADSNSRFSDIESEIRELRGKTEVIENKISTENSSHEKNRKMSDDQLADMQKKMSIMQDDISKIHEQLTALATELAAAKTEKAPTSDKQASAYESAEELFAKKEWKKAILSYQKFRDSRPKDHKIPDAIYKIGVCFQELSMNDEAKTFYDELINKYPNSPEAKKAKIRSKKL